jgi:hypothetical protein
MSKQLKKEVRSNGHSSQGLIIYLHLLNIKLRLLKDNLSFFLFQAG